MDLADAGSGALDALSVTMVLQTKCGSFQVGPGMEVVSSDGECAGVLRDVRPDAADILVRRPLVQRDVYIPLVRNVATLSDVDARWMPDSGLHSLRDIINHHPCAHIAHDGDVGSWLDHRCERGVGRLSVTVRM